MKKFIYSILAILVIIYILVITGNFHTAPNDYNYQEWVKTKTDTANYTNKIKIVDNHQYIITQDSTNGITVNITKI